MKVKRYEGKSEAALMPIITEEMGPNATIISVKQKPVKGVFGLFMKPRVVVTAAYEDDDDFLDLMSQTADESDVKPYATPTVERKPLTASVVETTAASGSAAIEESMNLLLKEARKAANQIEQDGATKRAKKLAQETTQQSESGATSKYKHSMVQLFYDTMVAQDVLPEVASHILRDIEDVDEASQVDVKLLIKAVYSSIVDILKNPTLIDPNKSSSPQTIFFMGPTGVGKTTTIAKLSSILTLKHNMRVGLITADTYRIAAVEQLKTYADILGLDIRIVYKPEEMAEHLQALREKNDIILVDTAGRSHKKAENLKELKDLLDTVPDSKRYLVLSVTTRYEDLCKIVNVYDQTTDFNLVFTKLDEAETLGSLMNICCLVGKKAAYVTFGQNVPDDLEAVKPDKIAKSLLGLEGGSNQPYAEGGSL